MLLPPEDAYAKIAKDLQASADRVDNALSTSEIARLNAPFKGAIILPSWSIGAALLTAHDALDTLAFLIGARKAPSHRRAHAALIREVLTGTLTPLAVLAPGSEEVRDEAARMLLSLDVRSYRVAARAGAGTRGPEMKSVRDASKAARPKISDTLKQHEYQPPNGEHLGSAKLIDRGIGIYAELMAKNSAPVWKDGEDMRTHLIPNLSSNATWSWNTTSGLLHGFHWPDEVLGEGDLEGFMPAVCSAAQLAAALASDAANLSASEYQETLSSYHP